MQPFVGYVGDDLYLKHMQNDIKLDVRGGGHSATSLLH